MDWWLIIRFVNLFNKKVSAKIKQILLKNMGDFLFNSFTDSLIIFRTGQSNKKTSNKNWRFVFCFN